MPHIVIEFSISLKSLQVERLNALITRTTLSNLMIFSKTLAKD
jgi:hypothetical protein